MMPTTRAVGQKAKDLVCVRNRFARPKGEVALEDGLSALVLTRGLFEALEVGGASAGISDLTTLAGEPR